MTTELRPPERFAHFEFHWLKRERTNKLQPFRWSRDIDRWNLPSHISDIRRSPDEMFGLGWRYWKPCDPGSVAVDNGCRVQCESEARATIAALEGTPMKRTLEDIRANLPHVGCDNETTLEMCAEIEATRAALRTCVKALGFTDMFVKAELEVRISSFTIGGDMATLNEEESSVCGEAKDCATRIATALEAARKVLGE